MKANSLAPTLTIERATADHVVIAIGESRPAAWQMVLLRSTWQSLGTALTAAYVADCYLGDNPQQRRQLDRNNLVSAIQLTMPIAA